MPFFDFSLIFLEMLKCKILFFYQVASNQQSTRFNQAIT